MLICLILWYGWRAMQIIIIMYNNDSLGWLDKDWKHWLTMYIHIHRHNTNIHLFINNTTRSVQCRWCMRYVIDSDSVHDIRDGDGHMFLTLTQILWHQMFGLEERNSSHSVRTGCCSGGWKQSLLNEQTELRNDIQKHVARIWAGNILTSYNKGFTNYLSWGTHLESAGSPCSVQFIQSWMHLFYDEQMMYQFILIF